MTDDFSVEQHGQVVVARVRGVPTETLLAEVHHAIVALASAQHLRRVLYDAREMEPPPVEVPLSQWKLDAQLGPLALRRAIVVPSTKLAYLARLAFADGDYRVFYDDFDAAKAWLDS